MIALLSSPTAVPVFDFGLPRKTSDAGATVRNHLETANIIINWASKPDNVKTTKRQLQVLETNKLPTMHLSTRTAQA